MTFTAIDRSTGGRGRAGHFCAGSPLHGTLQDEMQRRLAAFNQNRILPTVPLEDWESGIDDEREARLLEGRLIEALRTDVKMTAASAPTRADEFLGWFEDLRETGPGQHDPLFDWLSDEASLAEMRWFLAQEAAGEAGFDDLLAYTQVRLPTRAKLELARNYWDEMGRGRQRGMHGLMLSNLIDELGIVASLETTVSEALALANTMLGLAMNRRYAYHAVGALGVVELTAPGRVAKVAEGLKRLGFDARQRAYFDLHAAIDIRHSRDWNSEVIAPLVHADPECARFIAEGALMRLHCGARCFERYRAELWPRLSQAAAS